MALAHLRIAAGEAHIEVFLVDNELQHAKALSGAIDAPHGAQGPLNSLEAGSLEHLNVHVLGVKAKQLIAHASAHDERIEASLHERCNDSLRSGSELHTKTSSEARVHVNSHGESFIGE